MSVSAPGLTAARVMRILLGPGAEDIPAFDEDWTALEVLARRNRVLVRLSDRLERSEAHLPRGLSAAVERERERTRALLSLIQAVAEVCQAEGVEHLFPKALQHYPDMGEDLDLIVLSAPPVPDNALVDRLRAVPRRVGIRERIAGTAAYDVGPEGAVLDIHHQRLGQLGEYTDYPRLLIQNRCGVTVGGADFHAPSQEDQLILQGVERISGRRFLRISDLLLTVSLVRDDRLDWDRVIGVSREIGALHALGGYLSYADQIHREIFATPLLRPELRRSLVMTGWGRMEFRGGCYRIPVLRASGRAYAAKLRSELAGGRWRTAARLGLIPVVAVAASLQRLASRPGDRPRLLVASIPASSAQGSP